MNYGKQLGLFGCGFALFNIRKINSAFAIAAAAFFYKKRIVKHFANVKQCPCKNYRNNDALYHDANLTIICIYTIVL